MQCKLAFLLIALCITLAACDSSSLEAPAVTGEWVARLDFAADTTFTQTGGPDVRYQILSTHTYRLSLNEQDGAVTGELRYNWVKELARTEAGGDPSVTTYQDPHEHKIEGTYDRFVLRFNVAEDSVYVPFISDFTEFHVYEDLIIEQRQPSRSSTFFVDEGRVKASADKEFAFRRP